MKWNKHKVELTLLNKFCEDYMQVIRRGDASLEHLYCVFKYKESDIPQMMLIFDFIDLYHNKTVTQETISILYTYQPSNG